MSPCREWHSLIYWTYSCPSKTLQEGPRDSCLSTISFHTVLSLAFRPAWMTESNPAVLQLILMICSQHMGSSSGLFAWNDLFQGNLWISVWGHPLQMFEVVLNILFWWWRYRNPVTLYGCVFDFDPHNKNFVSLGICFYAENTDLDLRSFCPTTHVETNANKMLPRSSHAIRLVTHVYIHAQTTADAGDLCIWWITVRPKKINCLIVH